MILHSPRNLRSILKLRVEKQLPAKSQGRAARHIVIVRGRVPGVYMRRTGKGYLCEKLGKQSALDLTLPGAYLHHQSSSDGVEWIGQHAGSSCHCLSHSPLSDEVGILFILEQYSFGCIIQAKVRSTVHDDSLHSTCHQKFDLNFWSGADTCSSTFVLVLTRSSQLAATTLSYKQ